MRADCMRKNKSVCFRVHRSNTNIVVYLCAAKRTVQQLRTVCIDQLVKCSISSYIYTGRVNINRSIDRHADVYMNMRVLSGSMISTSQLAS